MSHSVLPALDETEIYQCVRCNSGLERHEETGLQCVTCGTFYPSIEGVRILVSNPDQLLRKHAEWLPEKRKEIEARKAKAIASFDEELHARESLALVEKSYDGLLANLDVVVKQMEPVSQYLSGRSQPMSLFSELEGIGWPATEMVEYFYRDWAGTQEAETLNGLFTETVERFCENRESVAVLGCGAGGLVHKLRELFPVTFGVDLAVDTLLLSKTLLDGGNMTLNYTAPKMSFPISQKAVRINGAAQKRAGIRLLAANVTDLPFRSASLSCVITQYMMDIVPSQRQLASGINRVLAEGGVWIDLSLPLSVSAADQFNNLDLSLFLKQSGFELLDQAVHRFDILDLSSLSDWAWVSRQTPVMFATKKVSEPVSRRPDYFADYFAKKGDAIWDKIPRRVADISLVNERRFSDNGITETKGVIVQRSNNPRSGSFPISNQGALMTEWFLRTVDGVRTIREIFDLMRKDYGDSIPPDEVLKFFSGLEESYLIEID